MDSLFTKIIKGEISSYKVAEDESHYAFLDIHPNVLGHTLCVPKRQVDKLFDLDTQEYLALMCFVKSIADAIEKAIPCNRVGMAVLGLEVPHAHVHLIPINELKDMDFKHKVPTSPKEFEKVLQEIKYFL